MNNEMGDYKDDISIILQQDSIISNELISNDDDSLIFSQKDPWYKSIILGYATGIIYVTTGFPLDTIKTRLQTQTSNTINKNLFRNIYKGVTPVLLSTPMSWSVNFWFYQQCLNIVSSISNNNSSFNNLTNVWIAAGLSSITWGLMITPSELIKAYSQRYHINSFSAIKEIYKFNKQYTEYCILNNLNNININNNNNTLIKSKNKIIPIQLQCSIQTIFRGYIATMVRAIPECTFYYGTLETLRQTIPNYHQSTFWKPFFAGTITGMVLWIFSMPGDTIKSHIQTNLNLNTNINNFHDNIESSSFIKTYKSFVKKNGFFGLWRGVSVMLIRAPILAGSGIVGMEAVNKWISKRI